MSTRSQHPFLPQVQRCSRRAGSSVMLRELTRTCKQCLLTLVLVTSFYPETRRLADGSVAYKRSCKACCKSANTTAKQAKSHTVSVKEKACGTCRKVKPADAFNKCTQHRTGLQDRCRECDNANNARVADENRALQRKRGASMFCRTCKSTKSSREFTSGKKQCKGCTNKHRKYRRHTDTELYLKVRGHLR